MEGSRRAEEYGRRSVRLGARTPVESARRTHCGAMDLYKQGGMVRREREVPRAALDGYGGSGDLGWQPTGNASLPCAAADCTCWRSGADMRHGPQGVGTM
ncbi:hypothetical protein GCM10023323_54490 [Streptomyces thinghirensis]|uniref:Uncharacterized protein n=1 Tax=Streptomyces thinghirensis TaxID=551547 RepID=A0ABP9T8V0_9ACTN